MKVLAVSDIVVSRIYSPLIRSIYGDVDCVFGCGDLPYYYLEYIVSALDKPVFYVRGNHSQVVEYAEYGPSKYPCGAMDLHGKVIQYEGLLLAGVEGSVRYRKGGFYESKDRVITNHRLVHDPGSRFGHELSSSAAGLHPYLDRRHQRQLVRGDPLE